MQNTRELYTHRIAVKQQELAEIPEEEQEELALIYQTKGIDPQTAGKEARHIRGGKKAGMGFSHHVGDTDPRGIGH